MARFIYQRCAGPGEGNCKNIFETLLFKTEEFFEECFWNNGHLKGGFPEATLEYPNIEKVRVRRMNTSYYLEGNDIVVNDLEEVRIIKKGTLLVVRGYQGRNNDPESK